MRRVRITERTFHLVQRGAVVGRRPSMTKAVTAARRRARPDAPVDIEMCGRVGGPHEPRTCWLQGRVRREGARTVFSPI